jgi:general secretion pathway protein G
MKLNHTKQNQTQRRQGFTLVEMLLVVAIIGILAALVIPRIAGSTDHARIVSAGADIHGGIKTAIDRYEIDNGSYPRSLNDLVQQPSDAKHWSGPYLDQVPVDPWGNPYVYYYPGKHNPAGYDLSSMGKDEKEGTDDDIGNW